MGTRARAECSCSSPVCIYLCRVHACEATAASELHVGPTSSMRHASSSCKHPIDWWLVSRAGSVTVRRAASALGAGTCLCLGPVVYPIHTQGVRCPGDNDMQAMRSVFEAVMHCMRAVVELIG